MQLRTPAQIVHRTAGGEAGAGRHFAGAAIGFTTEMDEWMSAADLMLGKPGGLTTAEACLSYLSRNAG